MPKMVNLFFSELLKTETCGQTVLPDRSVLMVQQLLENAKFKWDILSIFQTLCCLDTL